MQFNFLYSNYIIFSLKKINMSYKLSLPVLFLLFVLNTSIKVYGSSFFDPITVTTALDSLDGDTTSIANLIATPGADMKISLREAIIATNRTDGKDTIQFNIDSLDAGFNDTSWVIQQLTQYPKITDPICIDGYSQPGTKMNNLTCQDLCKTFSNAFRIVMQ